MSQILLLGERPDIIHLHDLELLQILPLLRLAMPRVKIVYDVHEDFPALVDIRGYIPRFLKPALKVTVNLLEKSLAGLTNGVVGVTEPLTDHFAHASRITVYNFPSRKFYETAVETARPAIEREYDLVHLGALTPERAHFLIGIAKLLCAAKPDIRICIAGLYPKTYDLLLPIAPSQCTLIGKIPYSEVPRLLGNAIVGLDAHPFRTDNLRVAIPVKVLEYMGSGCALVSSRFPLLDQLFRQAGAADDVVWIDSDSPEAFAQAIVTSLDRVAKGGDPGSRLRCIAARSFLWEREADKLARFYLEILQQ
jgi:glycosyltransferase involved in cell wall biosynthesis